MRLVSAAGGGGQSAIALLAALALCLQFVVPAVGTTARLVLAEDHRGSHYHCADHQQHPGSSQPSDPEQQNNHHGLCCCMISCRKVGTGSALPPSAQGVLPVQRRVATIVRHPDRNAPLTARRSIFPVGARAPPRFA
jgi:hypothetical protein